METGDDVNKRDQIFQAALRLFNANGYDKTPTAQIAAEANVATGTLFHYFSTKEELINSLYLHCKESLVTCILQGVDEEKSYRAKFKRAYVNMMYWGVTCYEEFLFFHQFSNSPNILESTHEEGQFRFQSIIALIREGVEQEILKAMDPEFLVNALFGLISYNILYIMQKPSLLEDAAFMESSFLMAWDSIRR